ncbi:MAG: T9SS type A sorting domain-containing protein [Ignavibacteria bacterium]
MAKMHTNSMNFSIKFVNILKVVLIITLFAPFVAFSQSPGNPVSIAGNQQTNPAITTDGSGGTIVTWQDNRNGKYEIYAQRMNGDGNALWTINGLPVCTQDSNFKPMIVSDGTGGAIIAWQSYRGSATADIYAQRINSSGNVMWSVNGLPVCVVVFEQDTIAMVSDGLGGAILTWQDYRSNNGFADIYAQRINPSGTMIWTANGVNICNQAAAQRGPKIIGDGSGGAFITWFDNRAGNYDIYSQRIAAAGAVVWTTNGVATCTMAADQLTPDICSDGANGVIITWTDFRSSTDFNIYAQRVGPSGAIVWVVDGVVLNNNVAYAQLDPKIVSDGLAGAIVSWTDYRTGTTADIYAQRVNTTGAVQWTATGVIICTATGDQIYSQLTSDGNNGAYITWEDHRNAGNSDIYAQRIASNAALNWAATGYDICTVGNDQLRPSLVSNGNLGALVVWQDYRSGNNFDVYEVGFNTTGVIAIENGGVTIPSQYSLSQNYPNPFNPTTVINYQLPVSGNVKLSIIDALGQNVSVLVNETQSAGDHSVKWNAAGYPSGIYFYKIEAGSFSSIMKMILIK